MTALQEEKARKLAALQELQQTAQAVQTDLQQYAENDPERVEAIGECFYYVSMSSSCHDMHRLLKSIPVLPVFTKH